MTPLQYQYLTAAFNGDHEEVASLLNDHPDFDVNCFEPTGNVTALHYATYRGHLELVKLLLAHPAINVNIQGRLG